MENEKKQTLVGCTAEALAKAIAYVLVEKKAKDITVYNVSEDSSVTDFYVNATGSSQTNVASLADEITYKMGEAGRSELRVEGRGANAWLLVDFGDVIVNIFDRPSREFYNFDRLFTESQAVDITDVIEEVNNKYDINKKDN